MGFHRFNCIAGTMLVFIQFSANTGVLSFCWTYRYKFLCCFLLQKHQSGVLAGKKKSKIIFPGSFTAILFHRALYSYSARSFHLSFTFFSLKHIRHFLARRCGLQLLFFICCFVKRDCKMQWGFAVRN